MSSPRNAVQKKPQLAAAEASGPASARSSQAAPPNPLWSRLATRPGALRIQFRTRRVDRLT